MDRKRIVKLLLTLIIPLLIVLLRPLGMDGRQSAVLAVLILVILWWVTGVVSRTVASIALLVFFLFCSGASPRVVFTFPLSENFAMIAFSFLFSYGIAKSGLADRLLSPVIARCAGSLIKLILVMLLSVLVMIFIIPQPFSRIILLAGIYAGYFRRAGLSKELQSVLMIGLFTFAILLDLCLLRGDLILNPTLVAMSGLALSEGSWIRCMAVPTLIYLTLAILLFLVRFRKPLREYHPDPVASGPAAPMTAREKGWLVLIAAVVVAWALEDLHGISGTVIVAVGILLMFPLKLLRLPDVKEVNVPLLIFLTAAFSIGGSLKASGVADLIFSRFVPLFPSAFSVKYALMVLVTTMVLHMLLGSNITAMSVLIPGLMAVGAGVAPTIPLVFTIFIGITGHSLLPFHNVAYLMGDGQGYFCDKELLRFTIPMTVLIIPVVLVVYLGWWHLIGLM